MSAWWGRKQAGEATVSKAQCCHPIRSALQARWRSPHPSDDGTAWLFGPLRPVLVTLVCFGVVPAAVTRGLHLRLSFHPLRSTLAWVLMVHTVGLLSLYRVLSSAAESFDVGNLVASWSAFPAVLAVAHVASYATQVPIWAEAHRYKEVVVLAARLEKLLHTLGMPEAGAWPCRRTARMTRFAVLLIVAFGPVTTALWQYWASGLEGEMYRIPAHTIANVLLTGITGSFCLLHCIIKDAATMLSQRFARDLDRGLSQTKMAAYYGAWLALHDLLEGAVFMPVSLSLCTLNLVLNNLLCLYHVVNRVMSGAPAIRTLVLLGLVPQVSLMFVAMGVAADAAVAAVNKFKKPLVQLDPTNARNTYVREVFREVLCHTPGSVCVAGYWYMNRRAATSILCVTITYLIVLIEFRTDRSELTGCNRTLNYLEDSVTL